MEKKGHVLIKKKFEHTTLWPDKHLSMNGVVDMEKKYKEALAGKLVPVMDIAVDDSGYLVLGKFEDGGHFLWQVEKEDTKAFIPVIKENGIIMPAGLSGIEKFKWMAKNT